MTGPIIEGPASDAGESHRLRQGLLLLAALTEVGSLVELAMLRHWKTGVQIIPWVVIGVLLVATILAAFGPRRLQRWVRIVAYLAIPAAVFGIWEHVEANHDAGPLDFRYTKSWPTMSSWSRWWKAATKAVGPSPPLTPGLLALIAFMVLIAISRPPRRPAAATEPQPPTIR